jgi:hypothetical protein
MTRIAIQVDAAVATSSLPRGAGASAAGAHLTQTTRDVALAAVFRIVQRVHAGPVALDEAW